MTIHNRKQNLLSSWHEAIDNDVVVKSKIGNDVRLEGREVATEKKNLAGIQYIGQPGISRYCKKAVMQLLQFGEQIITTDMPSDQAHGRDTATGQMG